MHISIDNLYNNYGKKTLPFLLNLYRDWETENVFFSSHMAKAIISSLEPYLCTGISSSYVPTFTWKTLFLGQI